MVIVNPAPVLGIGDGRSGSSVIISLLIPFYTEGVTAFVDVADVARALAMRATKQLGKRNFILRTKYMH